MSVFAHSLASGQLGINHSTVCVLCLLCVTGYAAKTVARLELENRFSIANCQFDDALSVCLPSVAGRAAVHYLENALGTWKRCGHNGGQLCTLKF